MLHPRIKVEGVELKVEKDLFGYDNVAILFVAKGKQENGHLDGRSDFLVVFPLLLFGFQYARIRKAEVHAPPSVVPAPDEEEALYSMPLDERREALFRIQLLERHLEVGDRGYPFIISHCISPYSFMIG